MAAQLTILCTLVAILTSWVTPSVAGLIFVPKKPHIRIQQKKTTLQIQKLQGKSGWQPIKGLTEVGSAGIKLGTDGKSQTLFFFGKDGNLIGQSEASDVKFHGSTVKPRFNSLSVTHGTHEQRVGSVVLISPDRQKAVFTEPAPSELRFKKAAKDAATVVTTLVAGCALLALEPEEGESRSAKVPTNNLRPLTSSMNGLNAFLKMCDELKDFSSETKSKFIESLSASMPDR